MTRIRPGPLGGKVLGGMVPAAVAARAYHGRYLTDADFDARARVCAAARQARAIRSALREPPG